MFAYILRYYNPQNNNKKIAEPGVGDLKKMLVYMKIYNTQYT